MSDLEHMCAQETIARLTRERDKARAEVERWKDAADDLAGPIERVFELRALLRDVPDRRPRP